MGGKNHVHRGTKGKGRSRRSDRSDLTVGRRATTEGAVEPTRQRRLQYMLKSRTVLYLCDSRTCLPAYWRSLPSILGSLCSIMVATGAAAPPPGGGAGEGGEDVVARCQPFEFRQKKGAASGPSTAHSTQWKHEHVYGTRLLLGSQSLVPASFNCVQCQSSTKFQTPAISRCLAPTQHPRPQSLNRTSI